jgi:hypothetical protein
MAYKDPEKQREYQRNWQRQRRTGEVGKFKVLHISSPKEIRTAHALLGLLADLIKSVLKSKEGDIFLKARTAGYLITIGLRAVEVADLESRIKALEEHSGEPE